MSDFDQKVTFLTCQILTKKWHFWHFWEFHEKQGFDENVMVHEVWLGVLANDQKTTTFRHLENHDFWTPQKPRLLDTTETPLDGPLGHHWTDTGPYTGPTLGYTDTRLYRTHGCTGHTAVPDCQKCQKCQNFMKSGFLAILSEFHENPGF